jgi:hypothetical protein
MKPLGYSVKISEHALREAILATVEAYALGIRRKTKVEIFGHLWGFHRRLGNGTVFFVDTIGISLSAKGNNSSVDPHPDSLRLKSQIVERWSPHLTLIGDFHSHPYETFEEVKSIPGYDFSKHDIADFETDDELWGCADDHPLAIVMTICEMQKINAVHAESERNNIIRFDIAQFRFWINAMVGYTDKNGKRRSPPNKHSSVELDIPAWSNSASDRIALSGLVR